jgi:hypothetical protein
VIVVASAAVIVATSRSRTTSPTASGIRPPA